MQFIIILAVIWGLWHFRDNILEFLFSRFRSSKKDGYNALSYSLSAIHSGLTDRERIVFRDNIDHFYRSLGRLRGKDRTVDVRYIETLLNSAHTKTNFKPEVQTIYEKVFKIISEEAAKAPGNLETELSVERIYLFLKDNI